jgi:putative ABC transport system substrate-binding protein
MRRRDFIKGMAGSTAATWSLAARAQQAERMRRVGVLESLSDDAYLAAFLQRMQQLGWADGRNVRIDTRWGAGNVDDIGKYAAELSALAPDVLLAIGSPALERLLRATSAVPIVRTICL